MGRCRERRPDPSPGRASFQQHIDVDHERRIVRVFDFVRIFLNERILWVDTLLVEIGRS
jgi:hypothetical protein